MLTPFGVDSFCPFGTLARVWQLLPGIFSTEVPYPGPDLPTTIGQGRLVEFEIAQGQKGSQAANVVRIS